MTAITKILLVDDDAMLRETVREQFALHEAFDLDEAGTGGEGLDKAKSTFYGLILLDVGLPDMDGREVCRRMRKAGINCPIIMLTGADSDADTILGLDAGANDYVTKPFRFGVLLARIRAHLRSHEQSEDGGLQDRPLYFPPRLQNADYGGRPEDPPYREGVRDPQISVPLR